MSENIYPDVGQRIKALRGELSQAAIAKRLGVSSKAIEGWEAGASLPSGSSLLRMHEAFGVDVTFLLTGKIGGVTPERPPDEEDVLANYRRANSDGRERIRQISATAANAPKRAAKSEGRTSIEGQSNQVVSDHAVVDIKGSRNYVRTGLRK